MRRRIAAVLTIVVALLAVGAPGVVSADSIGPVATIYTESNAVAGNAVLAYTRAADGTLSPLGTYPTGGLGTGAQLGSQGSVALSADGRWLAAVDAASNDVALFAVRPGGSLRLTDRESARGTTPISVTMRGPFVYVLDAGGAGNIAGFVSFAGHLFPLPGAVQPLSGPAGSTSPEEIAFSPDGRTLVVAEKGSNELVTYRVGFFGIAGPPTAFASAGAAPYGFAFDAIGRMFVSEAATSALSSYRISPGGVPSVISASVANGQQAACWVALTPDGRFAFTIDAHAPAAISTYAVHADGSVTLVAGAAATESTAPLLDASVTGDGAFLYVVDVGAHSIDGFRIGTDGTLTATGSTGGLPSGAGGLAAS